MGKIEDDKCGQELIFLPQDMDEAGRLMELLKPEYQSHVASGFQEALQMATDRRKNVRAVMLDAGLPAKIKGEMIDQLANYPRYKRIPVILYTGRADEAEQDLFLERGAADVLCPPFTAAGAKKRIRNAERAQDCVAFSDIEKVLCVLPSNIYLKDEEGRYIFATHNWHHIDRKGDPDWTIQGKKDPEFRKDKENAMEAMRADEKIIRTGEGCSYVIEIDVDQQQEFYKIIKEPILDRQGKVRGIVGLINDVTEEEKLRKRLEQIADYDSLTGLHNRHCFDRYLRTLHEKRDGSVALFSVDCNGLKAVNDTYGHMAGDEYIRTCSMILRMVAGAENRVFRVGGDEFVVVLENFSEEDALRYRQKIRETEKLYRVKDVTVSMAVGTAVQHLQEAPETNRMLLQEALTRADRDMYHDKAEEKKKRFR
jgi:diguanylate cyclase (GGDEF)-like protein